MAPVALLGPVKSAVTCTVPSGLTVSVADHTSAAFFPDTSGTGHADSAVPPLVTFAGGIRVHASVSERRQENDTLSYLAESPSAISVTRRAVRCPSDGVSKPPGPAWNV